MLDVAQAGLAAGDPTDAVERRVSLRGRTLIVDDRRYELDGAGVVVVGAGKASFKLAQALEARVGACIDGGLVVVPAGSPAGSSTSPAARRATRCPTRRARPPPSRSSGSCARPATAS